MPPTISPQSPVVHCEHAQNVQLTAGGQSIRWYADSERANLMGSGNVFYVQAGDASYFATQSIADCESDASKVALKPLIINSGVYYLGGEIHTREKDGDHYYWYKNNVLFRHANSLPSITFDGESATYRVRIDKLACSEWSDPFYIDADHITAIDPDVDGTLSVYPNPSQGDRVFVSVASKGALQVVDMMGAMLNTKYVERADTIELPTKGWAAGAYLIVFDDGKRLRHRKLIIL